VVASPPIALPGRLLVPRPRLAAAAVVFAHAAVALWVFAPAVLGGRVPYLRDVSTYFYPNLVFLERSLAGGTFPLWHPGADGGSPFLLVYPPDLLLVALFGARAALVFGPAIHTVIASLGGAALGRRLGMGAVPASAAGLVFALSGFMVSAVNLVPLHQAAAWGPLVLLAALRCAAAPGAGTAATLAVLAALQVSTLAGEIVLQTAAVAGVLLWRRVDRRGAAALAASAAVAALLSAPALLGAADLMSGTRRAEGFSSAEALAGSLAPVEAGAVALPRFFGDMHTFTNQGFWGQAVFAGGFPYLLSVYLGLAALTAAARAGRDRLWLVVAAGLLLALGAHGPFGAALAALARFRAPVKFLYAASLALALLAGRGLDRGRASPAGWTLLIPGGAVFALALFLAAFPAGAARLAALPPIADPAAAPVIRDAWPAALAVAGLLALAAATALVRGGRIAPVAAAALVADLLLANGDVNRFAPPVFYALRPEVRALLEPARRDGPGRVFGYGVGNTPGLTFAPALLADNADVWLYYLDRQVLWGRTPVLDGLEGALDEDRTGWAPAGATLAAYESAPARFRDVHARFRQANVRYVLSFAPLPADLADERGVARLPEVLAPLRLYEVRDTLPRAFFAADPVEVETIRAPPALDVRGEGPHAVTVSGRTAPGYFVLLSGWNAGWRARAGDGSAVPVARAGARSIAIATPGGRRSFRLEYRPPWWPRALALFGVGAALTLLAPVWERARRRTANAAATPPAPG
jgi:hypothetical protein